jgi:exonuclease SbcD
MRDTVRYCGTPLKYSFSECNHTKTLTIADFGSKGDISFEYIPLTPVRDMMEVKGDFASVISDDYVSDDVKDCYCRIILTDEDDIPDVLTKLRVIYKNIMKLDYDNQRTRHSVEINGADNVERKSPFEHFGEFYEMQNGQALSEEQSEFMTEIIEQIWGDRK